MIDGKTTSDTFPARQCTLDDFNGDTVSWSRFSQLSVVCPDTSDPLYLQGHEANLEQKMLDFKINICDQNVDSSCQRPAIVDRYMTDV